MDRGIPTEAILQEMRHPSREMFYLVGTPKARVTKYEKHWRELPWTKVRDSVELTLSSSWCPVPIVSPCSHKLPLAPLCHNSGSGPLSQ